MDIIKLYAPFISSLVLLILAFTAKFIDETVLTVRRHGYEFVISKKLVGRAALVIGALSILSYYLYFDFSKFFPSHLEVEVFYDKQGVDRSLRAFSNKELSNLGYTESNEDQIKMYYISLDNRLREILPYEGFFSVAEGVVHSDGETSFKVAQTEGVHKYYIDESKGQLTHVLEAAGKPKISFLSFFEKIPSSSDYIRPSISNILLKRELVISPKFKQIIAEKHKSDGVIFDHSLIGVTKVYLFPYPSFSNTVYFYQATGGSMQPIGYAVYK